MLSRPAKRTLNRIGDILIPRDGELPSYSEFGGVVHVEELLAYAPASDQKDLNLVLTILAFMPGFVLRWLVKRMNASHHMGGGLSTVFRQLDFGVRGLILSTYYHERSGPGYKGPMPLDVIGYKPTRIPL